jgi:hypothetical protein
MSAERNLSHVSNLFFYNFGGCEKTSVLQKSNVGYVAQIQEWLIKCLIQHNIPEQSVQLEVKRQIHELRCNCYGITNIEFNVIVTAFTMSIFFSFEKKGLYKNLQKTRAMILYRLELILSEISFIHIRHTGIFIF